MTAELLLCRECSEKARLPDLTSCPHCGSDLILRHPELFTLSIAHVDCDAFYASIEKRDNPELIHKPVIVGGGRRGVVAAACYVARIHGIRSAMPMFKALKLCPDAVVIPPRMDAYREAGNTIRELMRNLTPLVEPLSIDEAFLDLSGTEALHGRSPAESLIKLVHDVKKEVGVTVSVGLAGNKSMAKIASDMDKPRGFTVIGINEAAEFLAPKPVSILYGAGKNLVQKLNAIGITTCGDLARADAKLIYEIAGEIAPKLQDRAHGIDSRAVIPNQPAKSISSETTFDRDIANADTLIAWLDTLSEKVSRRMKAKNLAGRRVVLKIKSHDHKTVTRSVTLTNPTQMHDVIFSAGKKLLTQVAHPKKFWRLIGIGVDLLGEDNDADPPDLADPDQRRRHELEKAIDRLHDKHGDASVIKGRRLKIDKT
jgi:DNA polymerase-4